MQYCIVCNHEQRDDINSDLANISRDRLTISQISEKYGVQESSLKRHKGNHLAPAIAREIALQTRAESYLSQSDRLKTMVSDMAVVLKRIENIVDRAEDNKDSNTALKGLAEMRSTLAAIAKLTGVGAGVGDGGAQSSEEVQEARALIRALRTVLPAYPNAASDIAAELESSGHFDLASMIAAVGRVDR